MAWVDREIRTVPERPSCRTPVVGVVVVGAGVLS
jgi:hypothetical protein